MTMISIYSILESDNHSSAEYLKQLILMLLYNVCGRMDKSGAEDTGWFILL
ncbi:hypothetical protein DPMN_083252 [Dreissena polymorpha]|uniref:Uncharacterized protein n=1 Tax=Dreissena polymorpha TaxID=45954 RepID=A0A9D3Y8I2_DREPO|nr:hypothetical protein DPMN_083252 [Dreissena polymorpha]